jgi:hypothetical protein
MSRLEHMDIALQRQFGSDGVIGVSSQLFGGCPSRDDRAWSVCIGHNIQGAAVGYFAGLDVSLEETAICIVDDTGQIMREARVTSEPEALVPSSRNAG